MGIGGSDGFARSVHRRTGLLTLVLPLLLLSLSACSTQKAKWLNIRYHNLTCHYNVWWNGDQSLKAGVEKLHQSAQDDYTRFILPEALGTEEEARSVNPEMERALEKGVKGIMKHSILVKGKEHVPCIKDCYLLTAYASFYKQDYAAAANSCNIILSGFPGTEVAAEASVLMARSLVREKRFAEAEAVLDKLVADLENGSFPQSQRDKLYVAVVEATLPQEKFKKAVDYIHLAIDSPAPRLTKARLTFLMAQIYQHLDKRTVAAKYYHEVLSFSPPYVMEFNARLGEASCLDPRSGDIKKIERQLDAMIRDKKNEEFLDQIYYAKGEMYLGAKDVQRACDNFRRSVALAAPGSSQKARSALRLADILYDVYENYDLAQRYYDTVMQCAKKELPGYPAAKRRHEILSELVSYTHVYQRCDSILAVAALPEDRRMALIKATIDTLRVHEQKAREQALIQEAAADAKAQSNTLKGDWYFYNASTVQKGKEAFRKRWGSRTLEDLWFLSDKTVTSFVLSDDQQQAPSDTSADNGTDTTSAKPASAKGKYGNPDDPHDIAFYLKDLPTSSHQTDSLDSLVAMNLLDAAYIYYDGINNIPQALQCYLRLANEYTAHPQTLQAFYMLYRIYDRQGNTPQADYYRNIVLRGFPDSDFANLIRDDEYYKEILQREQRVDDLYASVYDLYARRRYTGVINLVNQAEADYPSHPLIHKLHYWKALASAQSGNSQQAVDVLQTIVNSAPAADSIVPLAKRQLELLKSNNFGSDKENNESETITDRDEAEARNKVFAEKPVVKPEPDPEKPEEPELPAEAALYRYRPNQQHYVVIVVNDRTVKATELQYRLADFNSQYYPNSGYKANAILFTDSTQLITIHRFSTDSEAMGYYRHLLSKDSPLRQYADSDHSEFVISTQNYPTFYNRKNIPAYLAFFNKYYIKQ